MPETRVIFYQDENGTAPVVEWLNELKQKNPKGFINCLARIQQLQTSGHELRRPAADYLQDGIRELRAKHRNVQYRIFYFFHGQNIAILAHAIIKKGSAVPQIDIEKTIKIKNIFQQNPVVHSYQGEI